MVKEFGMQNNSFAKKYDGVIRKIATHNNVDMSTGEEMFKTNLHEALHDRPAPYKGGGVIPSKEWKEMLRDYAELRASALDSIKEKE